MIDSTLQSKTLSNVNLQEIKDLLLGFFLNAKITIKYLELEKFKKELENNHNDHNDNDNVHIEIIIISNKFTDIPVLMQHKMVLDILRPLFTDSLLSSIQLKTKSS